MSEGLAAGTETIADPLVSRPLTQAIKTPQIQQRENT